MCRNSDVLDYANCTSLNMPMIALRVSETHGVSLPTFRTIEHHDQWSVDEILYPKFFLNGDLGYPSDKKWNT